MMPSPSDDEIDQLLARGAPGPARSDAIWERVKVSQKTASVVAWRKWLMVLVPMTALIALVVLRYEPTTKPDGFAVRGKSSGFAVARCLPRCTPGALLTFELAQTSAGYLHVWTQLQNETVWLYPDSNGFAAQIEEKSELQLFTRGIKIPPDWRGEVELVLVIQPTIDRAAAFEGPSQWRTTVRLLVEEK
jgi:hypothetical protein